MKNYEWKCPVCGSKESPFYCWEPAQKVAFYTKTIDGELHVDYRQPPLIDGDAEAEYLMCADSNCDGTISLLGGGLKYSDTGTIVMDGQECGKCGQWIDFEDGWSDQHDMCWACLRRWVNG